MISWYMANENYWVFQWGDYMIDCSSIKDVAICSLEAGISKKEMEKAAEAMDETGDNYAEFNKYKKFAMTDNI